MATHLVLGVTGGIGFWCARTLLNRGEQVVALVRDPDRAAAQFPADEPGLKLVAGDAHDADQVSLAAEGASTIIHGINLPYPAWHDPDRGVVSLLRNTMSAAQRHGARIIFPGNVYVFGHTHVPYVFEGHPFAADTRKGRLRVAMESLLAEAWRERAVPYVIVRFPDFYGPYVDNALYRPLFEHALSGKSLMWYGSLDSPLELAYIEDAAEAMLQAGLDPDSVGQTYHVPGPTATTAREWLGLLSREGGAGARTLAVPAPVVAVAGLFNSLAHELDEMLYLKTRRLLLTGQKYRQHFGSLPATPYEDGIRRTLDWYRAGRQAIGADWASPVALASTPASHL